MQVQLNVLLQYSLVALIPQPEYHKMIYSTKGPLLIFSLIK